MSVFRGDRAPPSGGRRSRMPSTSTLIRIAIVALLLVAIYRIIAGSSGPEDLSPVLLDGFESGRIELPDPISAATSIDLGGEPHILAVTKFGDDRLEPATLHLIRVGSDGALDLVSSIDSPVDVEAPPSGIATVDRYAYVPLSGAGRADPLLWTVDLRDPETPGVGNSINVDIPLRGLAVLDNRYLVASGFDTEFLIFDLEEPDTPVFASRFTVSISVAADIQTVGSTLFVDHMAGVVLVDLAEPSAPEELSRIDHPDWQIPGVPSTGIALLTAEERFDVQVPSGNFLGLSVTDDLLAVAASDLGLILFDIRNPVDPRQMDEFDTDGRAIDTVIAGDDVALLVASIGEDGRFRYLVESIDVEPPDGSRHLATFEGPHRFQRILTVEGRLILLFNDTVVDLTYVP